MTARALVLALVLAASAVLCQAANAVPRGVDFGPLAQPAKETSFSERLPANQSMLPAQTQPPSQEPKP